MSDIQEKVNKVLNEGNPKMLKIKGVSPSVSFNVILDTQKGGGGSKTVQFYDTRYEKNEDYDKHGLLVAEYNPSTFLDKDDPIKGGLSLRSSSSKWAIPAGEVQKVTSWLEKKYIAMSFRSY